MPRKYISVLLMSVLLLAIALAAYSSYYAQRCDRISLSPYMPFVEAQIVMLNDIISSDQDMRFGKVSLEDGFAVWKSARVHISAEEVSINCWRIPLCNVLTIEGNSDQSRLHFNRPVSLHSARYLRYEENGFAVPPLISRLVIKDFIVTVNSAMFESGVTFSSEIEFVNCTIDLSNDGAFYSDDDICETICLTNCTVIGANNGNIELSGVQIRDTICRIGGVINIYKSHVIRSRILDAKTISMNNCTVNDSSINADSIMFVDEQTNVHNSWIACRRMYVNTSFFAFGTSIRAREINPSVESDQTILSCVILIDNPSQIQEAAKVHMEMVMVIDSGYYERGYYDSFAYDRSKMQFHNVFIEAVTDIPHLSKRDEVGGLQKMGDQYYVVQYRGMPQNRPPTITIIRPFSTDDHNRLLLYGRSVLSLSNSNRIVGEILRGEVPPTYDWEKAME